jgi:hypothetical protein
MVYIRVLASKVSKDLITTMTRARSALLHLCGRTQTTEHRRMMWCNVDTRCRYDQQQTIRAYIIPMQNMRFLLLLYFILTSFQKCLAFQLVQPTTTTTPSSNGRTRPFFGFQPQPASSFLRLSGGDNNNENEDDDFSSLDELLDRPFFDPDAYDEDDDSLLGCLANFVKSDYELAETIFAGSLFVILIIITQELLRMQLYGDSYLPFTSSGNAIRGRLF